MFKVMNLIPFKSFLKNLRYLIQRWIVVPLLPKSLKDEYRFFARVRSMVYDDTAYKEMLLRAKVHQIDKVLTFKEFMSREGMLSGIGDILEEVSVRRNQDDATIHWCEQVLAEYQKRAAGGLAAEGTFELLYDAAAQQTLESIIKNRRSIRSFTSQAISKEDWNKIINAGLWAPSGCNGQPIGYLVLERKEDMKYCQKIAGETYSFPSEAPICVVILVDPRGYGLPGQRHMAYLEAGAAVQNMLLTARGLGIGSCWMFWHDAASKHSDFLLRFGLQPWLLPIAFICFGYPARVPKFPPYRKDVEKCIYYIRS